MSSASTIQAPAGTAPASAIETCTVKVLPRELWASAAQKAIEINPANAVNTFQLMAAAPAMAPAPDFLALMTAKYWGRSGVRLTVSFLDNPPADLRARILGHMNAWNRTANVIFTETASSGQVRIARTAGDGYWSYLGTDILSIKASEATMNLDSFTMNSPDSEFFRVVRHETGHTLGFPHEHLRREIIARIDREKAIALFMRTQGWSREEVIAQVLTPLDQSALIATAQPDPASIMCYGLPASIMSDGVAVPGGADIDASDAQFAASVYPQRNESSKTAPALGTLNNRLLVSFVANNPTNQLLVCSSPDGVVFSSNTLMHGERSQTAPSLANFGGKAFAAFVADNPSRTVLVSSSTDGTNWTGNVTVHGEQSKTAPSIAAFNNKLYVAFVANNPSNTLLACSSTDGATWTGNSTIHGERSKTAPSLAAFNGKLYVAFVADNASNSLLVCSTTDGVNWTGNSLIHGERSKTAPSLAVFNGKLYVAFVADNPTNTLLVCSTSDGTNWSANTPVGGERSKTSPSLTSMSGKLQLAFIADNSSNNVLICSSTDGITWTGNIVV